MPIRSAPSVESWPIISSINSSMTDAGTVPRPAPPGDAAQFDLIEMLEQTLGDVTIQREQDCRDFFRADKRRRRRLAREKVHEDGSPWNY